MGNYSEATLTHLQVTLCRDFVQEGRNIDIVGRSSRGSGRNVVDGLQTARCGELGTLCRDRGIRIPRYRLGEAWRFDDRMGWAPDRGWNEPERLQISWEAMTTKRFVRPY